LKDQSQGGSRQESRTEQLYKTAEYNRKRREELHGMIKNKEEEELKECTFKPQMRNGHSEARMRTKEEFLFSQSKFMKEKEEKVRKAQEDNLMKETSGKWNKKGKVNEEEWIKRFYKKDSEKK
jgi:hypothetical protein